MDAITHYQAEIYLPGHRFAEWAPITDAALLHLANNGTTPGLVSRELRDRADRIGAALRAGRFVETETAGISPVTADDFRAGRLTPTTGSERI